MISYRRAGRCWIWAVETLAMGGRAGSKLTYREVKVGTHSWDSCFLGSGHHPSRWYFLSLVTRQSIQCRWSRKMQQLWIWSLTYTLATHLKTVGGSPICPGQPCPECLAILLVMDSQGKGRKRGLKIGSSLFFFFYWQRQFVLSSLEWFCLRFFKDGNYINI